MKIVGISGSPRKRGNSEIMLRKALEGAIATGADIKTILLADKNIKMCKGCLEKCWTEHGGTGRCVIKDDMQKIYKELKDAHAFIFVTPTYSYLLSGLMKNFIDRLTPIWGTFWNKKAALMAVGAENPAIAASNLKDFCKCYKLKIIGKPLLGYADTKGEIKKDKRILNKCYELGKKLSQ